MKKKSGVGSRVRPGVGEMQGIHTWPTEKGMQHLAEQVKIRHQRSKKHLEKKKRPAAVAMGVPPVAEKSVMEERLELKKIILLEQYQHDFKTAINAALDELVKKSPGAVKVKPQWVAEQVKEEAFTALSGAERFLRSGGTKSEERQKEATRASLPVAEKKLVAICIELQEQVTKARSIHGNILDRLSMLHPLELTTIDVQVPPPDRSETSGNIYFRLEEILHSVRILTKDLAGDEKHLAMLI